MDLGLGTWDLALWTWDLALGTWDLGLGTWDLGPGTWDLGPGTWDLGFDNEGSTTPIVKANMSNGQGSSGLDSHLYMINE